jgi:SUMO ligase MMS21 Smc5/6 complex component
VLIPSNDLVSKCLQLSVSVFVDTVFCNQLVSMATYMTDYFLETAHMSQYISFAPSVYSSCKKSSTADRMVVKFDSCEFY